MTIARPPSGGPWRSPRPPHCRRRARRLRRPTTAAPTDAVSADRRRRRPRGRRHAHLLEPGRRRAEAQVAAFEAKYPKVKVEPGQRRHRQRPVHRAAERDQGRLRRARRRADRVLRPAAVRARRLARRPEPVRLRRARGPVHRLDLGRRERDGGIYGLPQDSGPMALFYNKEVFDKYGIAVPTTWDEYVAAAREAARGRPEGVHHQRHRRRRLHHQHDLAGRRHARSRSTAPTSRSTSRTRARKKWTDTWNQLVEERPARARSPAGATSGTRASATAPSPRCRSAPGCPAYLESGVADGAGKWRVAPMPTVRRQPR